jgi:hypothetical protein
MKSSLNALEARVAKLEQELEKKDRELREVSINRAEFVQQLNIIYGLIKNARSKTASTDMVNKILDHHEKEPSPKKTTITGKGKVKEKSEPSKSNGKEPGKAFENIFDENLEIMDALEPDKLEFMGKYSFRERMILMNRIDIYRLFATTIILSSKIKYPRAITNVEEKELKYFINNLAEFENLVLDLNIDENVIWDRGKVIEKQAIQLFTRFFNI